MYIDIDGVLLGTLGGQPALAYGARDFLLYAVEQFDCYWLTTHCRGDAKTACTYLGAYLDNGTYDVLKRIKPTHFEVLKTEAINPEDDFFWIDDQLLIAEQDWLMRHSKLPAWIRINTYENFYDLHAFYCDLAMR